MDMIYCDISYAEYLVVTIVTSVSFFVSVSCLCFLCVASVKHALHGHVDEFLEFENIFDVYIHISHVYHIYTCVYMCDCVCVGMYVGTIYGLTKTSNGQCRPNDLTGFAAGTVSIWNSVQRSIFSDSIQDFKRSSNSRGRWDPAHLGHVRCHEITKSRVWNRLHVTSHTQH